MVVVSVDLGESSGFCLSCVGSVYDLIDGLSHLSGGNKGRCPTWMSRSSRETFR